ncbi:MAG: tetratricopeptide repeat protein [Acidobacteria bacterium]|nr:tetratricopeptide repeat protein [Acidobacteriota bacterium]
MQPKHRNISIAVVGGVVVLGAVMFLVYDMVIRPNAPRNEVAQNEPAPIEPVAPPPADPTAEPPPAPIEPPPQVPPVAAPKPATKAGTPKAPAKGAPASPTAPPAQPPFRTGAQVPAPKPPVTPKPEPPKPEEIIKQGMDALNAKDYTRAVGLFRQARELQPSNPDLGYLLGMALENTGEPGAALDAYNSCTSGPYAQIAKNHVKMLAKKLSKRR